MSNSILTKQWRISKLVSRQNYRYSMHPAKIKLDFRLATLKIRKCNATKNSKSSSKYQPKTQSKKITQLIYSQYSMITNLLYKIYRKKTKYREMEIRNEQPSWISTSHKQLRNSPKKKNKIPSKFHSLSQAKTSEFPPTAKYHFVVN